MTQPFFRSRTSVVGWLLIGQTLTGYLKVAGRVLAPYDVSPQQALALGVIAEGEPPMTPGRLARSLGQETQSITGLIDRLESRGWITRDRALADRRKVVLALTDAGRERLQVFMEPVQKACDEAFGGLDAKELDELVRLLGKTNDGIRSWLIAAGRHTPAMID
jgi:DNA-binding MarR family transcriptional regulator